MVRKIPPVAMLPILKFAALGVDSMIAPTIHPVVILMGVVGKPNSNPVNAVADVEGVELTAAE